MYLDLTRFSITLSSYPTIPLNNMVLASADTPLLLAEPDPFERTGTVWTAVAHIVTGVIGSGVLSLAWSVAQLGWIAGPLSLLLIASITLFTAVLLCNAHRYPDPELGPHRSSSYLDLVHSHLGVSNGRLSGVIVSISLYGFGIAFIITAAISLRAIQSSICYQNKVDKAACESGDAYYILLFGALQILLSQIPNFHNIKWLSVVAATMSFAYAFIAIGLCTAQIIEKGHAEGSIEGISASSGIEKLWLVSQALGDISFAFPFATIIMEIQDTLKSPPPENVTMKKASTISVAITTLVYLASSGAGYAAFGDNAPGNLLTGFGSSKYYWLVCFANACIVVHLVGSYQVFAQPVFATAENWLRFNFPDSGFMNHTYTLKLPLLPVFELNFLSLTFRTAFVTSTTVIAMVFPYFNQILGVLGSLIFWPLTIYFPVEIYLRLSETEAWTTKWVLLETLNVFGLVFGLFTLIGCIEGLVTQKLS
ncbi:hypothetical protein RJT34_00584 [Clitoria ternatea]|uniref:Amino acid transporter transmembrane domain-containing protein n=1 Tax=Clitoria ternatea TaxID=43366 RepID=A0AAN9PY44_CLITE